MRRNGNNLYKNSFLILQFGRVGEADDFYIHCIIFIHFVIET